MLVSSLKDEAEGFISGPLIAACCFHLLSLFPSVVHLTIHLPTLSWSWPGQTGRKVISDEEFARRAWKKRPACGDSVWKSKRLWWIGASAQGVCGASWGINKVGVSQKPIKAAASRHVWPIGARCLPMFCTALLIFLLCLPYTQPTVASADHSSTGVYASIVDHKIWWMRHRLLITN